MDRTIDPTTLKALLRGEAPPSLLDVRRAEDRAKAPGGLPGAVWLDPAAVADWGAGLPAGQEVVLYCVRGGSVSNSVLDALLARGLKARHIEGGLEAWQAAGGAVEAQAVPLP
jgi:rhodanese-related sulfurtransferase